MTTETATALRSPAEYANDVEIPCKPGVGGHTATPCLACEDVRRRIANVIFLVLAEAETQSKARVATVLRAKVEAAKAWATATEAYKRLDGAFAKVRVVLDMPPSEAARIAHERWIDLMLKGGFHPATECPTEKGCPLCDHELMAWNQLPHGRRLVREAGVEALFGELRRRAGLLDPKAGEHALAEMRAGTRERAPGEQARGASHEGRSPAD